MKGRPIDQMVYECMFPKPRQNDPQGFHALLQRSLIPEVRHEVQAFYGHLETNEAKYPGLDYNHPTHRVRLSRWQWHRRLFRAFDALRLTPSEISGLTKWEGTLWAKERFEREQGITIRDTTADGFPDARDVGNESGSVMPAITDPETVDADDIVEPVDEDMDGDESEEELESVGIALNERLRERAAAREAGDASAVLDEEWEQWLKNAIENGELPYLSSQLLHSPDDEPAPVPETAPFPPRMLSAARAGQWQEIPDFLHDLLRRALEPENRAAGGRNLSPADEPSRSSTPVSMADSRLQFEDGQSHGPSWRRTYGDLRLPVVNNPTAPPSRIRMQRAAQAPHA